MPVKDNRPKTLWMRLLNVSLTTHTATFQLWGENNEPIGTLKLYYRKIIDHSQKMGSEGEIRNPSEGHFPDRIIIKRDRPKGH